MGPLSIKIHITMQDEVEHFHHLEFDRPTNRLTNRTADRLTKRRMDRLNGRQTERQTDWGTNITQYRCFLEYFFYKCHLNILLWKFYCDLGLLKRSGTTIHFKSSKTIFRCVLKGPQLPAKCFLHKSIVNSCLNHVGQSFGQSVVWSVCRQQISMSLKILPDLAGSWKLIILNILIENNVLWLIR